MARPVGVNDGPTLQDQWNAVPMVTKILTTGTLGMTLFSSFGLLSVSNAISDMDRVWHNFELQRLFLPFLYAGGFSFNFAIHLLTLYQNCKRYEANPFNTGARGTSADFVWLVILGMILLHILNIFFEQPFLSEPLLIMIMYVWSRREPDQPISLYGMGPIKSVYLPWVYMAIRIVMGGSFVGIIMGIIVGHIIYFFYEVLPQQYPNINMRPYGTPNFCVWLTEKWTGMSVPRAAPPAGTAAAAGFRAAAGGGGGGNRGGNMGGPTGTGYQWGRGRVLGTN